MVQNIMHELCLPTLVSKRPVWDTFPGAWYTMAADVVMPNGRTLQVATYHHYRDQWADAFDLSYEDATGETKMCHQTTFGMSERLLGAVVGTHGDDKGLIMPPSIAPFQVVVMPVASHADENVLPAVEALASELNSSGIRTKIDSRDVRPGVKHYDWEIKGVPIRVELGPRDLKSSKCIANLRTGGKIEVDLDGASAKIMQMLSDISDELRNRANSVVSGLVQKFPLSTIAGKDVRDSLEDGVVYEIAFDGNDSDAEHIEKTTGLTLLGESDEPFHESQTDLANSPDKTTKRQYLARMY